MSVRLGIPEKEKVGTYFVPVYNDKTPSDPFFDMERAGGRQVVIRTHPILV
jgi:hypothetical protein